MTIGIFILLIYCVVLAYGAAGVFYSILSAFFMFLIYKISTGAFSIR